MLLLTLWRSVRPGGFCMRVWMAICVFSTVCMSCCNYLRTR